MTLSLASSGTDTSRLDWVIIGGGIHGVHLAVRLLEKEIVAPARLRIVDPAERLLARWRACTDVTGMEYLRSPSVHHLGLAPTSLDRFAGKRSRRSPHLFAYPYDRPSLDLFNRHCEQLIEFFGLRNLHLRGRVEGCRVHDEGVTVELAGSELNAANVVLAIGSSDQPYWPEWAPRDHEHVQHIFDRDFPGLPVNGTQSLAVVGGGISAAQLALRLSTAAHKVTLITRHPFRQHQFDSDPGWLGPKNMTKFAKTKDLTRRRDMIRKARHRGSMPPDVIAPLRQKIQRGKIEWVQSEPSGVTQEGEGIRVTLPERDLHVDRVLLATGFSTERPGGSMIDGLIESANLPCAACGYPIVDHALRWHHRIRVSGPLAELELGPTSRNIAGARRSADLITQSICRTHKVPGLV